MELRTNTRPHLRNRDVTTAAVKSLTFWIPKAIEIQSFQQNPPKAKAPRLLRGISRFREWEVSVRRKRIRGSRPRSPLIHFPAQVDVG